MKKYYKLFYILLSILILYLVIKSVRSPKCGNRAKNSSILRTEGYKNLREGIDIGSCVDLPNDPQTGSGPRQIIGSCKNVTLTMYDSYTDGWNGSIFTITGNDGTSQGPYSITGTGLTLYPNGGGPEMESLILVPGVQYTIDCGGGSYELEISWELKRKSDDSIIIEGGAPDHSIFIFNDDGTPFINGCMDSTANNFNGNATRDNGTICTYNVYGCTDVNALNYDSAANTDDGSCIMPNAILTMNDMYGDGWTESTLTISKAGSILAADTYGPYTFTSGSSKIENLNLPDGIYETTWGNGNYPNECYWTITDPNGTVLAEATGTSTPVFDPAVLQGSTLNDTMFFTIGNTTDVLGCTDPIAFNYVPAATINNNSCIAAISGCMDETAANYDSAATTDDNSCIMPNAILTMNDSYGDSWNGAALTIKKDGIMYDGPYTVTSGLSEIANLNLPDGNYTTSWAPGSYDSECSWTITDTTGAVLASASATAGTLDEDKSFTIGPINGCTNTTANNYDAAATTDDGSCTYDVNGCTDMTAFNYNDQANTDDGSCVDKVYGCTDSNYIDYNSLANINETSATDTTNPCSTVKVYGCTNCISSIYNTETPANVDDGTCGNVDLPPIPACASASCFDNIKNAYNTIGIPNGKKMYQMAKVWYNPSYCYASGWPCKVLFNKENCPICWYVVNMYYNGHGNNEWGMVDGFNSGDGWGSDFVNDLDWEPPYSGMFTTWQQIYP